MQTKMAERAGVKAVQLAHSPCLNTNDENVSNFFIADFMPEKISSLVYNNKSRFFRCFECKKWEAVCISFFPSPK